MPLLQYFDGRYEDHDGRRRSIAADRLGSKKIPVVIQNFKTNLDSLLNPETSNFKKSTPKKQNPFTFEEELI